MKPAASVRDGSRGARDGSVLVLALFLCLAVMVAVQALATVVVCADRALGDEIDGRTRLAEKDQGLAALRQQMLGSWTATSWKVVCAGPDRVEGRTAALGEDDQWVLEATVRQDAAISRLTASAWVERGRDGIDLPLAGLVAGTVSASPGRSLPWMELDGEKEADCAAAPATAPVGYVRDLPSEPLLGEGCTLAALATDWRLDPGWRQLLSEGAAGGVAPAPGVVVVTGRGAQTIPFAEGNAGLSADAPLLAVVMGGADLDARGRGDLYGVLAVDGGSVLLEGTTLHGAIFATEGVFFGETGRLLFSRPVLRWAADRSFYRVRLVPGSRAEGMD